MAKKQDVYYFNNFVACAEESCHAAHLLKDVLANFNPDDLTGRLDEMHAIETRADGRKHEAMDRLAKELIPPIEREDIITLSQHLDDLTDKIEDVLLRIYMNHVTKIEPAAVEMTDVIIRCCEAVKELLEEFSDFKSRSSGSTIWRRNQTVSSCPV